MKAIILAGGSGSRLYPLTACANKQLQPVYNKPMIYYPLSTLMLCGVREFLIITNPESEQAFKGLLGDGSRLGISISHAVQYKPDGIARAFVIGEDWIDDEECSLILGDNLFYGNLGRIRSAFDGFEAGATIFGYPVSDPERYGVVELSESGTVEGIVEKPHNPRSNLAVPGLYLYDSTVCERAGSLQPSERGELEITDLNLSYLHDGVLNVCNLGRGMAWLDTGTPQALQEASAFVSAIEQRQGLLVGSPEEAAIRMEYVKTDAECAAMMDSVPGGCDYARYLEGIVSDG